MASASLASTIITPTTQVLEVKSTQWSLHQGLNELANERGHDGFSDVTLEVYDEDDDGSQPLGATTNDGGHRQQCQPPKSFKAHRVLLVLRCPYFQVRNQYIQVPSD